MTAPLSYHQINKNRRLFGLLRNLSPILYIDLLLTGRRTIKEAAERLGLKTSTYYRLRIFFRDHREIVMEARRSDNWRPVEEILFPELMAAYPHCADNHAAYNAAMADWHARTGKPLPLPPFPTGARGKKSKPKEPKPRRRPPRKAPEPKSWLSRTLESLGRWLG